MLETKQIAPGLHYGTPYQPGFIVAMLQSQLTERELSLMLNCVDYASADTQGGLPGHNLMVLIAKLVDMMFLDREMLELALKEEVDILSDDWDCGDEDEDEEEEDEEKVLSMTITTKSPYSSLDLEKMIKGILPHWNSCED